MRSLKFAPLFFITMLAIQCGKDYPPYDASDYVISGSSNLNLDYEGLDLSTQTVVRLVDGSTFIDSIAKIDILLKKRGTTPGYPSHLGNEVFIIGSPEGRWSGIRCEGLELIYCYWSYPDTTQPSVLYLGDVELSTISEVPESGYQLLVDSLVVGNTFAVITQDLKYSLFQVTAISDTMDEISIDWKYQPTGDRSFK
jgi:hypothetical protein